MGERRDRAAPRLLDRLCPRLLRGAGWRAGADGGVVVEGDAVSWAPGTIVVCVDDSPGLQGDGKTPVKVIGAQLVRGYHYTVRGYFPSVAFSGIPDMRKRFFKPGVLLEENVRLGAMSDGSPQTDYPWAADRFRLAESTHSEAGSVRQKEPVSL